MCVDQTGESAWVTVREADNDPSIPLGEVVCCVMGPTKVKTHPNVTLRTVVRGNKEADVVAVRRLVA